MDTQPGAQHQEQPHEQTSEASDDHHPRSLRQLCLDWLKAWSGDDHLAVVEMLSEDISYRDPVRSTGLRGKQAVAEYLELLFVRNPGWRYTLIDCWEIAPDTMVIKRRVRNVNGDRVFEDTGVEFLEFRNGLVWDCEIYYDRVGLKQIDYA